MDMHDHLASIDETRINWTLKVRVTRMWPSVARAGNIVGHNMILLDCENTHMHAFVRADYWNQFHNVINEGSLYSVTNFRVRPATGYFRPVHSTNCIIFLASTIVNLLLQDDFVISMHKFEPIELGDLYDHAGGFYGDEKPLYSADVIGVMENLQQIQTVQTQFGEQQLISFTISDGRVSHKVYLWGPLNATTASLYQNDLETPIILILESTRVSLYKGQINITNLPSSKIFINLIHEDVYNMRQRLLIQGYQPHHLAA